MRVVGCRVGRDGKYLLFCRRPSLRDRRRTRQTSFDRVESVPVGVRVRVRGEGGGGGTGGAEVKVSMSVMAQVR